MSQSTLEKQFALFLLACKGPDLIPEVKLVPGRKFRCDFVHPESRTVIELEGLNGRHQHIRGFIDDCEKYLEVTLLGYRVIRLTSEQITVPIIERIVKFMKEQS